MYHLAYSNIQHWTCLDHFFVFDFQILSQITGKAVTDVMAPHKDVLQDMIPPKKHLLRHQPVNAQVHYANPSINLCSYLLLSEGRRFIVQDLFVSITRKSKNDWLVKVGTHSLCTLLLHTKDDYLKGCRHRTSPSVYEHLLRHQPVNAQVHCWSMSKYNND